MRVNYQQYKFKDAVSDKGHAARWHVGVIAQRVKEAFETAGLDAFCYGLLCYDEWDACEAEYDDGGVEVSPARPAGNRYGIRYDEALVLEAALMRRATMKLEARVAALENASG